MTVHVDAQFIALNTPSTTLGALILSVTLLPPASNMSMLLVFKSLWTMPRACRYAKPADICRVNVEMCLQNHQ
jgi:hypothetical protein